MAASQESSRQYSVGGFKLKEGNKIEIVVKALRNLSQQKSSGCSHHKPLPEAGSSGFFQLMKSRFNSGVPRQWMNKKLTSLPLAPQIRGTLNIPVMDETGWSYLWGWWSVHDFWEHFPAFWVKHTRKLHSVWFTVPCLGNLHSQGGKISVWFPQCLTGSLDKSILLSGIVFRY